MGKAPKGPNFPVLLTLTIKEMILAIALGLLLGAGAIYGDDDPSSAPVFRPTVLIHGMGGTAYELSGIRFRLEAAGFPPEIITAMQFPNSKYGNNEVNAVIIATKVQALLVSLPEQYRGSKINIIAHSMGGLSARHYIKFFGGLRYVHTFISLAVPHHGMVLDGIDSPCFVTLIAPSGLYNSFEDLCSDNDFLLHLNSGDETPGDVRYVSIYSTADGRVPNWSSHLEGAINIPIDNITHSGPIGFLHNERIVNLMVPYLLAP